MALRSIVPWATFLFLAAVLCQDCFYPNGSLSTGTSREAPCYADGGICCPLNWECMSDGLCYYPPDDFYGRYSCTDPTWKACPDICTYDYTAFGGEAILQCDNGKWCCDHNRPANAPCCSQDGVSYFDLPAPKSVTSITALAPVTAPASTVHNPHSTSSNVQTTSSSASSSSATTTQSNTAATVTHESTTTGKDGSVLTVTQITTMIPSGTGLGATQGRAKSSSGTNLEMILGLALGIPLVLILAAILIFFLCRRKRKNDKYKYFRPSSPPQMANYANIPPGTHAPELAGYPVADTGNKRKHASELSGISSRTGESTPPAYSPGGNGNANAPQAKSPAMSHIPEEPQELSGESRGYVPYRPEYARLRPDRGGESGLAIVGAE